MDENTALPEVAMAQNVYFVELSILRGKKNLYVDVIDDKQRGALQSLTGNSTLTQNNINSLKVLGFNFELVQEKPQDINF